MKDAVAYVVLIALAIVFVPSEPLDFAPLYNGARALAAGTNPYSDTIMRQNQLDFYGRLAASDEDQHRMSYPLTTALVYLPLTALPITAASAIYRVLSALFLVFALVRYGASPFWAFGIIVLSREPLSAFFLGQTALLTSAFVVLGLDALDRQQDYRAALYFAFSTLHPILTIPLALLILLPHRSALVTFITIMLAWLGLSVVVGGFWIPDWVITLTAYSSYVSYMVWLPRLFPLTIPMGLLLIYLALRQRDLARKYALALSAVILLLPITGLYQLTLFTPVFVRLPRHLIFALGIIVWALSSIASFEVRQYTPLLFAAAAIVFCLIKQENGSHASMRKGLKSVFTS